MSALDVDAAYSSRVATAPPRVDEAALEELLRELDGTPEAPCEARPSYHGDGQCTHEVTHRLQACRNAYLVCGQAAEVLEAAMRAGLTCRGHAKPISEHWKLVPA